MSASREKKRRQENRLVQGSNAKKNRSKAGVDRLRRGIVIAVVCVFVLAIAALAVLGSGMPYRMMPALTINGVNISVAEYNFHYFSNLNNFVQQYGQYFGWNASTDFEKEEWTEGMTIAEYFHEQTVTSLQSTVAQSEKARSQGISISDSEKRSLEATLKTYSDAAAGYNMSTGNFLARNYGQGVDENILRTALDRLYLSSAWQRSTAKGYSDELIDSAYSADKASYDWLTYRSFTISGAYTGDLEGDEKTKAEEDAKAEAKAKADEMLSRVTTSDAFKALSDEYAVRSEEDAESGDEAADDTDNTLYENVYADSIGASLSAYLFDDARVNGDKTVIEDGTNYTVVLFLERGRDESTLVSIRHILIQSAEDYANATDEQKAAARAVCEDMLDQWRANGATEDAFAELAMKNSQDGGSMINGGLYEDISNEGWEPGFADWCFDPARKPGDSGVIDTSYGSHAMYFISHGGQTWTSAVRNDLLTEESSELVADIEVSEHGFALSMTRKTKAA